MKQSITNFDENGKYHGKHLYYHPNGNIWFIWNYHHGKPNGYQVGFNPDKSIEYKSYWNMGKSIYEEDHWFNNQIKINI